MAYEITKSDGTVIATVADGTVDTESTSLNLIGKNFAGYGLLQNENFVALLENFANDTAPTTPVTGQLWYDKNSKVMKYRSAENIWRSISTTTVAPLPPISPILGDHWWNNVNQQLSVYDGQKWILVGPTYSSSSGLTGTLPDVLRDKDGVGHVVLKFYINDVVVAIWSKDETPYIVNSDDKVVGFYTNNGDQTVRPGMTMADLGKASISGYNNIDKNTIWGTAENALRINGINGGNFLRKDSGAGNQEVALSVQFNDFIKVAGDILSGSNFGSNIGSPTVRFNTVHAKSFVGNIVGNITNVLNLSNHNTDSLAEGNVNLYFTANRARESVSAGTGLNYTDGQFSVDTEVIATQSNLALKANIASLANVAISGSYNDLLNKPTLPTAINGASGPTGPTGPTGATGPTGPPSTFDATWYTNNSNLSAGYFYQKFPSGFIIQGGYASGGYLTFPTPFPNACVVAVCATNREAGGASGFNHVYSMSNTGVGLVFDPNPNQGWWVAFGY